MPGLSFGICLRIEELCSSYSLPRHHLNLISLVPVIGAGPFEGCSVCPWSLRRGVMEDMMYEVSTDR